MLRFVGALCVVVGVVVTLRGDVLPWLEARYVRRRVLAECTDALPDLADVLDGIERDTRQGHSLHGALRRLVQRHPRIDVSLPDCTRVSRDGMAIDSWCTDVLGRTDDPDVRTTATALLLAARTGAPHRALSVAARVMRQRRALRDEARLATVQARASMQALTWLPGVVLVILLLVDDRARSAVARPLGLAVCLAGIGLNLLGWRWMRRMYVNAMTGDDVVPDVLDALSLEVAAGRSPGRALLDVAEVRTSAGDLVRPVRTDVEHGALVSEALRRRRDSLDPHRTGWVDAIIEAEREGFPLARLLEQLSDTARAERRRGVQRRLRVLSVRVTAPLVTCVLPAFVLLAIVPMVAGVVTHLSEVG